MKIVLWFILVHIGLDLNWVNVIYKRLFEIWKFIENSIWERSDRILFLIYAMKTPCSIHSNLLIQHADTGDWFFRCCVHCSSSRVFLPNFLCNKSRIHTVRSVTDSPCLMCSFSSYKIGYKTNLPSGYVTAPKKFSCRPVISSGLLFVKESKLNTFNE